MSMRLDDLRRFYAILDVLEKRIGGRKLLADCHGRMHWPKRGVYFFMEDGERRSDSGEGLRIVRVGTHALTSTSKSTLWKRLSQHKGQTKSGGGNHRGSIFRLLVGSTFVNSGGTPCATWGDKDSAPRDVRDAEHDIECAVSRMIRAMPFLWLAVDDPPGTKSLRGTIERNSIALLSNLAKPSLDPHSPNWRGLACARGRARVRDSGLWNQNHVDEDYDPAFLDVFEKLARETEPLA
ncbi:MAG TPA: hypothetical protein VGF24_27135 [Vicinamibacterales bacterium]|jgi:hypothetical protein